MPANHDAAPMSAVDDTSTADPRRALAERLLRARLARREHGDSRSSSGRSAPGGLSSAQERMWFLHTMNPHSPAYTISSVVRLRGPVDVGALRAAVGDLVERHPMLRTQFVTGPDGLPRRDLVSRVDIPFVVRPGDDGAVHAVKEFVRRPFDLARAPLVRVMLTGGGEDGYLLALAIHHIVCDGWSLGVLHRDLGALYGARRDGHVCAPAPVLDVEEVVAAEQRYMHGPEGQASRSWWRAELADLSQLVLPMARPRPAVARFMGRRRESHIPAALVEDLEALGRRHRCSLYMVLGAVFATLLHRYSGQTDIVFGSPVANRSDPALTDTVGLFANSVVLRADLSGEPSFTQVLARFRHTALSTLEHQRTPFELVVDDLRPERSLSHNPLFQVMFALQNAEVGHIALAGTAAEPFMSDVDVARFDLEWTLWRRPDGARLRVNFAVDLFDDEVIEDLIAAYVRLLAAVVAEPDRPVGDLSVLHDPASGQRSAPPPTVPVASLHALFDRVADGQREAVAVEDGAHALTFDALRRLSRDLAGRLRVAGVGPGDIVAVCTARTVDLVVATLGSLTAGAACLPLNPDDPRDRRDFMLADAGTRVMVCDTVPEGGSRIPVLPVRATPSRVVPPATEVTGDHPAYIIYTSGTTGRPKGVVVRHRNILNTLVGCHEHYGFGPDDVGLVLAASTFDVFYHELFSAMLAGGRSRLVSRAELFDPPTIVDLLTRATVFQAVPGLVQHLLAALAACGRTQVPGVRVAMTGGDQVPPALLTTLADVFPRADVIVMYGPTETTIFATAYRVPRSRPPSGFPIGSPLPGVIVRVADERGNSLPAGMTGEIWIGGAGVSAGYHNRDDENARRFVVYNGQRFYRSGDRGRWRRDDGVLEFRGRADNQVKIRGFRIELDEIESVLTSLPRVRQAVVVPTGEDPSSRRLIAYVVPDAVPVTDLEEDRSAAVGEWRELFDQTHEGARDAERDFTGWNSSYDGTPIPAAEMAEWADGTAAQLRQRLRGVDGHRPRVLEIGCGTGLLLNMLAPDCERYVGTDFSAVTVATLRRRVDRGGLGNVDLRVAEAAEGLPADLGTFDAVVLNSVAQYLPDATHLRQILDGAVRRLRPGGFVFVGDVRSLPLLETFHVSVAAAREPDADATRILDQARRAAAQETELVLAPAFFRRYAQKNPRVTAVEIEPRRGLSPNELNRYRYDVVLWLDCRGRLPVQPVPGWLDWATDGWTAQALAERLAAGDAPVVALAGIPHALVQPDVELHRRLSDAAGQASGLVPPGAGESIAPERLRMLAAAHGYQAALSWARGRPDGAYDVVLVRTTAPVFADMPSADPDVTDDQPVANQPVLQRAKSRLSGELEAQLASRLPAYMMPSSIMVLDSLPLTANQKVDRSRLPVVSLADPMGRPPSTATEQIVAAVWREVLGHPVALATDDFFTTGGTSLLAIRMTVGLRQRGYELGPQRVFEHRTVERLAGWLDHRSGPTGASEPTASPELTASPASAVAGQQKAIGPTTTARERDASRLIQPDADRWTCARRVLLTGATGMLGVHLLDVMLRRYPKLNVVCLLRGQDDAAAWDRLVEQYRWYFPDAAVPDGALANRVRAVAGDLRKPRLGLHPATWRELGRDCDVVMHAAADVRHVAAEQDVFAANADGTARVLELCAELADPWLCHISTIGVAGRSASGAHMSISEEELDIGQVPSEAYSASKLAAERTVAEFNARTAGATVLRVGTVAPHSQTGRFQRNIDAHFFSRYVRAVLALGVAADWPHRVLRLIPVDVMAAAVFALTGQPAAAGRTFHVQSPHQLTHGELAAHLRDLGYPIRMVPPGDFAEIITALGTDPALVEDVGRMLPSLELGIGRSTTLRYEWTAAWLDRLGHRYPPASPEWIARFVRHGVDVGYFPDLPTVTR